MKNPLHHQVRTPFCPCPYCGYKIDAASGERDPMPGDISVCIGCAQPLRFADDLTLQKLSSAEFDALPLPLKNKLRVFMAGVRKLDRRTKSTKPAEPVDRRRVCLCGNTCLRQMLPEDRYCRFAGAPR